MPEPILTAVATALATKAATGLYELVKERFTGDKSATKALVKANGAAPGSRQHRELTATLHRVTEADPAFAERLHQEFAKVDVDQSSSQHAETDGVTNHISGNVSGNVVQARDVHGGIRFN